MNNNNNTSYVGLSFLDVLLVVFIALKIAKVIDWSWWLVLLPLWIQIGLVIIIMIVIYIISKI